MEIPIQSEIGLGGGIVESDTKSRRRRSWSSSKVWVDVEPNAQTKTTTYRLAASLSFS